MAGFDGPSSFERLFILGKTGDAQVFRFVEKIEWGEVLTMSTREFCEPLSVVEVDLSIENKDAAEEATYIELHAVTQMMRNEKMVLPVYAASLTPDGIGCVYIFESYDSGKGHVLAVHEPKVTSSILPIHYLLIDAEGRTGRIIIRERKGS